MLESFYRCVYPSPEGTVVGARVGVALGGTNVGSGGGSVGVGESSTVGSVVWVGVTVEIIAGTSVVSVGVGAASRDKWGTYSCCPT